MNRIKIIVFLVILLIALSVGVTYSFYISKTSVSATSKSSNIICEYDVNESEDKYGYKELVITIKNYKEAIENGVVTKTEISPLSIKYTINVTDNEYKDTENTIVNDVNGLYGYNYEFKDSWKINEKIQNTSSKQQKEYKIQVKTDKATSEEVSYKVKVDCVQLCEEK